MIEKDHVSGWFGNRRRYDAILAAIPASFGLTYIIGLVGGIGNVMAIFLASIASSLLLLEAIFINPPTSEPT
ncbi:MAG: hypothetical protein ABEJ92_02260 [Halobacteriales archaeon]